MRCRRCSGISVEGAFATWPWTQMYKPQAGRCNYQAHNQSYSSQSPTGSWCSLSLSMIVEAHSKLSVSDWSSQDASPQTENASDPSHSLMFVSGDSQVDVVELHTTALLIVLASCFDRNQPTSYSHGHSAKFSWTDAQGQDSCTSSFSHMEWAVNTKTNACTDLGHCGGTCPVSVNHRV